MKDRAIMKNYKKIAVLVLVILVNLLSFLWLYSHAFVEVVVSRPANAQLSYTLTNQDNGQQTKGFLKEDRFKKLLVTGKYELRITGSENSYITVLESGRFLTTTAIAGSTTRENKRDFVGYNPAPCMRLLTGTLYSYECGSKISNAQIHVPATESLPTYSTTNTSKSEAVIQDIAYTKLGALLLSGPIYDSDEGDLLSAPQIGLIESDLKPKNSVELGDESLSLLNTIVPYKEGFLLHAEDLRQMYYFSSLASRPTPLQFPGPSDAATRGKITSDGEVLVGYYASDRVADDEETQIVDAIPTDLYIQKAGTLETFKIDQPILNAVPCGGYVCVLTFDKKLTVYGIGKNSLKPVLILKNITEIHMSGADMVAVDSTGVFTVSPKLKTGSYLYTFGGYTYCGWQPAADGFTVCLIDNKKNKVAAYVSDGQPVLLPLDKRVLELQKNPKIDTVSTYKNFVYITPVITTQIAVQGGGLDSSEIKKSQELLKILLPNLGLEPANGITVVNTVAPF